MIYDCLLKERRREWMLLIMGEEYIEKEKSIDSFLSESVTVDIMKIKKK